MKVYMVCTAQENFLFSSEENRKKFISDSILPEYETKEEEITLKGTFFSNYIDLYI